MTHFEEPILKVRELSKKFGDGCDSCNSLIEDSLDRNYCPVCGTIHACQNISFDL